MLQHKIDLLFRFFIIYRLYFGIYMLIRLVSLILYVMERWVDETDCLRAIGFLNQYNKAKLSYMF